MFLYNDECIITGHIQKYVLNIIFDKFFVIFGWQKIEKLEFNYILLYYPPLYDYLPYII